MIPDNRVWLPFSASKKVNRPTHRSANSYFVRINASAELAK
jgi:hypothetical protein